MIRYLIPAFLFLAFGGMAASADEAATCGGIAGLACAEGEYCAFTPEAACGAGDVTAKCEKKPEICTKQYMPVCGCDGKTYGNACEAAAAGVSVAAEGACG